jgi:hypothetical protein
MVLRPKDSHSNLETASLEPLFGVGSEARDFEVLGTFCRIAVEGPLEPLLKVMDHDLLDARVDGVILGLEIGFIGKELLKKGPKPFIDVA